MYIVENYHANGPGYHVISETTGKGVRALTLANFGSQALGLPYHDYDSTNISFGRPLAPEVAWDLLSPDNYYARINAYKQGIDETSNPDLWQSASQTADSAPAIYNCDWLNIGLQSSSNPPQMDEQGILHVTPEAWNEDAHMPAFTENVEEIRDIIDRVTTDVDQSYVLAQHKIVYDVLGFPHIELMGSTVGVMDEQTGFYPKVTVLERPPQAEEPFETRVIRPAQDVLSRWGDYIIRNKLN